MRIVIVIVAAIGLCPAQTAKFEVASIKPSAIPPTHLAYVMSDTRVDLGFTSLKILIQKAYGMEEYQVSGPEWMATSRFDILAKLPDGATKEQIPDMLQALLADRFGLVVHKEPREQQVYALLQGKDGPKLTEGAADNSHPDLSFLNGRRLLTKFNTEDGYWTISQLDGPRVFDASRITLPELARTLTAYVDIPVVDMTGLKGNYRVSLEVPLEVKTAAARIAALARAGAIAPGDTPDTTWGASIFKSVQKLGLTLEKRKAPVETLVIDHAEKVPTEN
jgi:uncharacterized protein (TIGR03435 family)